MNSAATHIVTRCEWNTSFDSKNLATTLQTYISKWSTYKMQRIIDSVFDRICPEGQTLKIKKLAIDLGAITYENMERELPIRLKNALYEALYSLIMYPKSGDQTLEIINSDNAQLQILKTFLLEGILPWNYHESYGSASHIMNSQLTHNRLEIIQLIQKIGVQLDVRKRIVWQFNEAIIKKVITGLEPNNHQQIISFSEEFVKIQEKENVLKTSTQSFKKNLWLWILNYLFVDRGTIFNKIAFVRSTIVQIANHFNISYEILVELIETAIQRHKGYSSINNDFIVILKLLSEELYQTSIKAVKTEKQQENFWNKISVYFNSASARTNSVQKNEFNELVINLSKLDAKRFQKIILKVEQKSQHWETILKDLIPAAVENLFVALSPSESKNILTQIEFLTSLESDSITKVKPVRLYALGIEFCVQHQNSSVAKHAFLTFVIEKVAKKQQQSKVVILDRFLGTSLTQTTKKTAFIPLFNELKNLFQQEISTTKIAATEKVTIVVKNYIEAITNGKHSVRELKILEKKMLQWIAISPKKFWNAVVLLPKNTVVTTHISVLISAYGTQSFLKEVHPKIYTVLEKIHRILDEIRTRNPKYTTTLRAIQHVLVKVSFSILWNGQPKNIARFFSKLLCYIQQEKTIGQRSNFEETMQLIWKHPNIKTLGFSTQELANIQQQYKIVATQTPLALLLETTQQANQQEKVATLLREIVRSKKIQQPTYQKHTELFITYLLSNGMQLRNELISTFLEKITKQISNKTTTEIQVILEDTFWQTLVLYTSHKGNREKFSRLFETTLLQTFSIVEFQKAVPKTTNLQVPKVSETNLTTILELIEKVNQQEKVAALLSEIVLAKKIQHSSYQKHTKTFIPYLLSNGIQLHKKLFTKFLKQFAATETSLTTTQIEEILDTCFWESITLYTSHKGNEQQFSALFETTVMQRITDVKKQEKKPVSNVKSHFETIEVPIKITATTLFEIIEKMLVSGDLLYSIDKKTYTFSEVCMLGLETSPKRLRTIIQQTVQTKQQVSQLQNALSFEEFISLISKDTSSNYNELYQSIRVLFALAKQFGNTQVIAHLNTFFWKETIQVIQSKSTTETQLKTFIHKTFEELSNVPGLDLLTIVKHIQQRRISIPTILKNKLIAHHGFFEAIVTTEVSIPLSKAIKNCISEGKIEALSSYLVTQFSIPAWFQHTKAYTYETVLETLVIEQPLLVLKTIRSTKFSVVQLTKLSQTIRFSTLVNVLIKLYPLQQKRLVDLQKLYESMAVISVTGISTKVLQDILSKKVWKAWQTSNWTLLSNTHIWNELLWETCGKKNVKQHDFINAIQTIKTSLPSALQLAFTSKFPQKKKTVQISETIQTKTIKPIAMSTKKTSLPNEGISIPNAGLVLLNNYFLMLMDRLGIVADKQFKTPEDQLDAVHYFQYVVTGLTATEESFLILNKILSGLSPDAPVKGSIDMTEDQKQLIDGLIQAAIGYWSAIGDTSINGFRGNWLVRDGILRETEDRWELTVEKRAYDILLMKSPFSFSIIKLPWMEKPLHVTWTY